MYGYTHVLYLVLEKQTPGKSHNDSTIFTSSGRGLGNILSRIFGKLIPFLKTAGTKVMKSATTKAAKGVAKRALKSAGKSALKAAGNAALNALEGKPVKQGVQKDLASAKKELAQTVRTGISIAGKKAKKRKEEQVRKAVVKKGVGGSSFVKRKQIAKSILD